MTFSSIYSRLPSLNLNSVSHFFSKKSQGPKKVTSPSSQSSQMQLCLCGRSLSTVPGLHSDNPHQQTDTAFVHTKHQLSGDSESVPGALSGSLAGVSAALALFKVGLDMKKVWDDAKKIEQRKVLMNDLTSSTQIQTQEENPSQGQEGNHSLFKTYSLLLLNQQLKIKKRC